MSFDNSFWSRDYHNGLNSLFKKLEQGCVENAEVLALAQARAEIEESYGLKLREIETNFAPKKSGFDKDDGASMRQAYVGILGEMTKEGQHHLQVANNIRKMVLEPFTKWSDEHAERVEYSRQTTNSKVKEYERHLSEVTKVQKRYFNKCRLLEELRESENASESGSESPDAPEEKESKEIEDPDTSLTSPTSQELTINGKLYTDKNAQDLVSRMLKEIPQRDHKVPILGTYTNTSTGAEIVQWIQLHLAGDILQVEKIGQQFVDEGILRLVGQVGSKFANSSVMVYQWRPRAYELAGISFNTTVVESFMGSSLGETITERWKDYYGSNSENAEVRLSKEVRDLDQKYRKSVIILDNTRSQLGELLTDHFKFMQKCETDRLKALKAVVLDLVASQSNVVPSIQASVDKQLLYQESMNPATDLRYIVESYRTGPLIPQVTIYDNYYSSSDGTIFGMDLELRSRGDGKPVPYIISTILGHLDKTYPRMVNDEARLKCWTQRAPLHDVNQLRREINLDAAFDRTILDNYDPQIVVSTLGLYLFQLPDSVLPSQFYDVLKAIYAKHESEHRLTALQNTLSQCRVSNIATLDVLTSHVNRLVSIAKADEDTLMNICKNLAPNLLRPTEYTPYTLNDSFSVHIVKDLIQHREIFKELRKIAQPRRENSVGSAAASRSSSLSSTKRDARKRSSQSDKSSNERVASTASNSSREPLEARISRIASNATSSSRRVSAAQKQPELKEETATPASSSTPTAKPHHKVDAAVESQTPPRVSIDAPAASAALAPAATSNAASANGTPRGSPAPPAHGPARSQKADLGKQLDDLALEAESFQDASDVLD